MTGNTFTNLNDGAVLSSGESNWTVALNNYNSVTTKVSNGGTGNLVGTCTPTCLTNLTP